MELGLLNRCAIVTGGTAGIGLETALALVREGARVAITGRDPEKLDAAVAMLRSEARGDVLSICADSASERQVSQGVDRALEAFGQIDILVNNAGAIRMGDIQSAQGVDWEGGISAKLMGYIRFARLVTPGMRARRSGRVVNVIGRRGHQPASSYIVGSTVNAALRGFTKALAEDLARYNVLVNAVNPGPIATKRWKDAVQQRAMVEDRDPQILDAEAARDIPLGRLGTPREVAAMIVWLCSEQASFVSGCLINVDGGATPCI